MDIDIMAPTHRLSTIRGAGFRKWQTTWYDGSMPHQKDYYRLGVLSYSSDPSGERVGLLMDVP